MIESNNKLLKIVSVYFLPSVGVEEISENYPSASITLYDGYDWEEIKFTEASYKEPASETSDGTLYQQSLQMVLAGDDATIQARLLELETSKPIIRFDYHDGTSKIFGDKENYCKVLAGNDSTDFVTKNYVIITRSSSYRAFFLI